MKSHKYSSRTEAYYAAQKELRAQRTIANRAVARSVAMDSGELKSVDTTGNPVIDTTGAVTLLNGIARGDEINERNGREVLMKSIQLNMSPMVTSGTGVDQVGRALVVYDRQTNAAAPAITDILVANNYLDNRNLDNRKRFKILMDRRWALNATGEPGAIVVDTFYRRLRHPVTFNSGDAGTVADITTGSLYLITIGTKVAGATAGAIPFRCRIRYQDK